MCPETSAGFDDQGPSEKFCYVSFESFRRGDLAALRSLKAQNKIPNLLFVVLLRRLVTAQFETIVSEGFAGVEGCWTLSAAFRHWTSPEEGRRTLSQGRDLERSLRNFMMVCGRLIGGFGDETFYKRVVDLLLRLGTSRECRPTWKGCGFLQPA